MNRTSDLKLGPPKKAWSRYTGEFPPELPDHELHPRRTLPLVPDKFVKPVPEPPEAA